MAIKDFSSNVSDEQRQQAYNRLNPPEYEPGFEPQGEGGADDFDLLSDDLFDGSNDLFSSSGGDMFSSGGSGGGSGDFSGGGDPFSSSSGLGGGWGDMSGFNSGMGGAQNQPQEKDNMDKAIDYSAESIVSMGHILIDLIKSMGNRSSDDWALISNKCIIVGAVVSGLAIVLTVVGIFSGFGPLRFVNAPATCLTWGLLTLACGLAGLSSMVLLKLKSGDFSEEVQGIDELPDASELASNLGSEFDNSYDSEALDEMDETMENLLDDILNTNDLGEPDKEPEPVNITPVSNPEDVIKNITDTPMITRKYLLDTLIPLFPENTPNFGEVVEVERGSDEFLSITACMLSAIASACNKDEDDINLDIKYIESTLFSYTIRFARDSSFRKTNMDTLKAEIVNYFKSEADDGDVTVQLKILAGDYICILSKGKKAIITVGDCLKREEVSKYFYNENNKLPFIMGIDELGEVHMADAKDFPSLMIVGMSRSGKSWYVNSFIMSLATFNDPSTVQFLVIDPKESVLFKTIGLLPHCCGVHSSENVIIILKDILDKEAKRRKKLLEDHRCDSIWELRSKRNIQIPYLYIIIDEVMSIKKSLELDGTDKQFLSMLIQIITQLPSLGIGVLIVPHRATNVIDKTIRSQMHFRAAVKADNEVIRETLDVTKWNRALTTPGDIALRTSVLKEPIYVKATGVALSDSGNSQLIANVARAFYKMGVEDVDMTTIGCGYNRDIDHIREELKITLRGKIQFDIDEDI